MVVAPRPRGLLAGMLIVALVVAASLTGVLTRASDGAVDAFTTSSVSPASAPVVASIATPKTIAAPEAEVEMTPKLAVASLDLPETPAVELEPITAPEASEEFLAALEVLGKGEQAEAYKLASALPDPVERRTIQWAAIYYGDGEVASANVLAFTADAPEFAADPTFKTRLEQALNREKPSGDRIIELLGGAMPATVSGQIALAEAYVADGQAERAARIARAIWTENFLDKSTEARVLDRLGSLIDADAHWNRAVYLMMHDRATGVERLMKFLTPAQKSLATARNAVSRDAKDAKKLLDDVDPSMTSHPVYLFSRAQRARQFELWDDAIDWLDKAKGTPPEAAEFWYERRALVRQLLALGEVKRAYRAADGYREGPDGRLVEAHFHAGWIALNFLRQPADAITHFEAMTKNSTLPDSVTQANYWLGRAQQAAGDEAAARTAFEKAAEFGTVYYGQLARAALGLKDFELRDMPDAKDVEPVFEQRDLVRAVRLLAANDQKTRALTLLRSFAPTFTEGADLLLSAQLAEKLGSHQLAISIADTAERLGFPLDLVSFPETLPASTKLAEIDMAAVYAITRQESRFQLDAVSSAGARGLMQLMPATAKETAGKLGVTYSKSRLTTDAAYNSLLGSTYLKAQLERFDGSLLLAAAAYNAGAGNARKWINAYGDPRSEEIDPVVWVELIPLQETRTYVKRVLGNYLVYRARLGKEDLGIEAALRRIPG